MERRPDQRARREPFTDAVRFAPALVSAAVFLVVRVVVDRLADPFFTNDSCFVAFVAFVAPAPLLPSATGAVGAAFRTDAMALRQDTFRVYDSLVAKSRP
jgi:hypothetical protein